ncbi:hypothetical protein FSP39_009772 [Pinctada imbricata]|uniref:Zinc finger protein 862 n=1 Tax=Pinctada imbricata TaxID=66713 RepID=A0AA89C5P3_PINIB|nr:hypothetical protein FSP39_009772 [Pinctada imbricata]
MVFCEVTEFWWLVYVEGQGMFCLLCKENDEQNMQNKSRVFSKDPSVRFKKSAVDEHRNSAQHKGAVQKEMIKRLSVFHKEKEERNRVGEEILRQAFLAAYWLLEEEISLRKLLPLLKLVEKMGLSNLRHFQHRSEGSIQELFHTIGDTVKNQIISKVKESQAFGILLDEVTDISVKNQMVLFIQYVDAATKQTEVAFFAVADVLEESTSANSETLQKVVEKILSVLGDDKRKLSSVVTDGASVMTGKFNGLTARLRKDFPSLISVHCICHRLALACVKAADTTSYVKNVSEYLRQLWKFIEDSPKRTAVLIRVQLELANCKIQLPQKARKAVVHKVKKACTTRWLSFEAAVHGFYEDMSSILQALREMKEEVIAKGLLVKMFKAKFISAIYILNEVLPILPTLSRTFQAGTINYARIEPSISYTMDALNGVLETGSPVTKMEEDLQEGGRLFTLGLHPGEHEVTQMKILLRKYIEALQSNIRDRFDDVTPLLSSFSMFDPTLSPNRGDDNFNNYGEEQIKMISKHFYGEAQEDQMQLTAEWKQFKYHFEKMKETSQYLESTTPTEYCLRHILQLATPFGQSFPLLSKVAEIILSMPISNAWPERGASAVKRIKTRLRNRLSNKMLETVMQVNINGPGTTSAAAETIVKQTVKQWYEAKQRRKLPKCEEKPKEGEEVPTFTVEQRDVSTQADIGVPEQDIQEKVHEVLKLLNIRSKELVSESSESEESEEEEADYEIEKELEFEHVEQN